MAISYNTNGPKVFNPVNLVYPVQPKRLASIKNLFRFSLVERQRPGHPDTDAEVEAFAVEFAAFGEVPIAQRFRKSFVEFETGHPVGAAVGRQVLPAQKLIERQAAREPVVTFFIVSRKLGDAAVIVLDTIS